MPQEPACHVIGCQNSNGWSYKLPQKRRANATVTVVSQLAAAETSMHRQAGEQTTVEMASATPTSTAVPLPGSWQVTTRCKGNVTRWKSRDYERGRGPVGDGFWHPGSTHHWSSPQWHRSRPPRKVRCRCTGGARRAAAWTAGGQTP